MPKFVYDPTTDRMVDKETGEPMVSGEWKPVTPQVFGDLPGYASPIDGSWIEGRRARKYDLEKNNCVPYDEVAPSKPRKLKNEAFAEKHGLKHLMD